MTAAMVQSMAPASSAWCVGTTTSAQAARARASTWTTTWSALWTPGPTIPGGDLEAVVPATLRGQGFWAGLGPVVEEGEGGVGVAGVEEEEVDDLVPILSTVEVTSLPGARELVLPPSSKERRVMLRDRSQWIPSRGQVPVLVRTSSVGPSCVG